MHGAPTPPSFEEPSGITRPIRQRCRHGFQFARSQGQGRHRREGARPGQGSRKGTLGHEPSIAFRKGARLGASFLAGYRGHPLRSGLEPLQAHGRRHRRLLRGLPARRRYRRHHVRAFLCAHVFRRQDLLSRGSSQQRRLPLLHLWQERLRRRLAHLDIRLGGRLGRRYRAAG